MNLILLNLESNQQIKLNSNTPLIIGRGNIQGCFDKRVSRNHGRVTCTVDGKVRVAALHCNPCFFTRNGVPPVQQLNKDEEETLNEGDYLGLLPNAFWFKITSIKGSEIKNEPDISMARTDVPCDDLNQTFVLKNCNKSPSNHSEIVISKDSESIFSDKTNKDNSNSLLISPVLNKESNLVGPSKGFGTPEFEKTKRLPLWMYEIDDPISPDKSSKKHSLENVICTKGKKQKILSDSEIKKEVDTQSTSEVKVEDKMLNLDAPSTSKVENNNETSNPISKIEPEEEEKEEEEEKKEKKKVDAEKEGYESGVDDEESSTKRPICQYEGNCYRKNPQHKLDFSHPGDPDYVTPEERPVCQYGAACYRKNEKHRVEYRHPPPGSNSPSLSSSSSSLSSRASSPLPAKRRRKNIKQNFDYEDDDECDLEDPFLSDASSDEYIPSNLESEDEGDLDVSRDDD